MLRFLGRTCARHHWVVLSLWLLAAIGLSVASSRYGGETINDFAVPNSDSQEALDILAADFPQLAGSGAKIVFQASDGQTVADHEDAIQQTVANLGTVEGVVSVSNPFATSTELLASQTSDDGTIAYASVLFTEEATDLPTDTFEQIEGAAQNSVDAGLNVQFAGDLVEVQNPPTSTLSDYADEIGLAVALVLLLLVFRSVFIAVLPIVNAIIGVTVAGGIVSLLENSFTIPTVGPTLGTMLGLGIGVDYSLFILTRADGELAAGYQPGEAMGRALATAGRAVVFAGVTICMATIALVIIGISMIGQMGVVAALYVLIMVFAAVTLVPALGGAAGSKLLTWRFGPPVPMNEPASSGLFAGLARLVTRRPVVVALFAMAVMLVLATPFRDLQTGWVGSNADPPEMTQTQAYNLLSEGFGPGVNGELIIVLQTGQVVADRAQEVAGAITALQQALEADPAVQVVSPPLPDTTPTPTAFAIEVQPTTGPDDPATSDLARTIRSDIIPQALGATAFAGDAHVGGVTATIIDLDTAISDAMPEFIAFVLGGAFLLLLLVFRSVLVGVTAVLMNLLTISATFGVLVAVFQWGWGNSLIGMTMEVDIVSFVPLLVFAIVFGLSMDYEVFLMSRMQEEYAASGDPSVAVSRSVGTSGRVIISAAFVMFAVFIAFVTNPSPLVKQIGLGLAVGVLIDALVVRLLLVPSLMRLLGKAGWWLPRWLDRILPNISIEGGKERS